MAAGLDRRELIAALAPGAALGGLLLAVGAGFAATLEAAERDAFLALLAPRAALLLFVWLLAAIVSGVLARAAYRRWVASAARLAEQAGALLAAAGAPPALPPPDAAALRSLAATLEAFARERQTLREDVQATVQAASRGIEQERNRLAALMAELAQSVVACNLDGRVLLCNARARVQFRALSSAPGLGGGNELVGLGRSIYALIDRALVAHALDDVARRLQRGDAHPSAQFVTGTRAGQLLRVQLAPVRSIDGGDAAETLAGFVLMIENITREFATESERDRLLQGLTEGSRASLGNLQAAVEMLDYDDVDATTRERFLGVIRDEVGAMGRRLREVAAHTTQAIKTRWPLEDMHGADLVAAACRRIESQSGCRAVPDAVDAALWLKVDSFSLLQALVCLAGRLADEYGVRVVQLRLARHGARAALDLVWTGAAMSTETVMGWEAEPMRIGSETLALSVHDVVERHDGAFWLERERVRHLSLFRLLLPLAEAGGQPETTVTAGDDARPEVYDFDLFRPGAQATAQGDTRLDDLTYTVFDAETTGLDPSAGDEILQIGALRIVAGKLRREDRFEQLVDPRRDIPAVGIAIHGITPERVAGAPTLDAVLPAFHAFAQDTVLVAHNAAFDMRFLELKQAACGCVFDQPVLDTLLLSALVHPQQESHRLEAIAERLGVAVQGRHTALGDATVTAEVFLKLIPLLAERGITTLAEAREASRQTWFARVRY